MSTLTPANLAMKEIPKTNPIILGGEVIIDLRGVVGATGVMVKIAKAFDAILTSSHVAETELIARWKSEWGMQIGEYNYKEIRRQQSISRRCRHLGLPSPVGLGDLDKFLKINGLAMERHR